MAALSLILAVTLCALDLGTGLAEETYKAKIKDSSSYRLKRDGQAVPKPEASKAVRRKADKTVYKSKQEEKGALRFKRGGRGAVYKSKQGEKASYVFDSKAKPVKRKPPPKSPEKTPEPGTSPPTDPAAAAQPARPSDSGPTRTKPKPEEKN